MSGRHGPRPHPIRLPSPLAQAVLVVVGAVALVLFVLQLTAPRPHDFVKLVHAPTASVETSRE